MVLMCVTTYREVFDLRVRLPDVVAMQTRLPNLEGAGEIPLHRLVKEALRVRPSRIVVGEVRQEECLDLKQSSSGLPRFPLLFHMHAPFMACTRRSRVVVRAGDPLTR